MADRRTKRERVIAASRVQGERRALVRIPADQLAELNADLPEGIRVLPTGRYQARYRGADKREVSHNFSTLADARDWRAKGLAEVAKGDWTNPRAGKETVEHYYRVHLANKGARKASTRGDLADLWDRQVDRWAAYAVAGVNATDVEDWVRGFTAAGYSVSTTRRCVLLLKGIMDEAVRHGAVARNPVDLPRLKTLYPPASQHEPSPLTLDQLDDLLEHSSRHFCDLTEFIARTGLRISEARELRVKDVHLTGSAPNGTDYGKQPMLAVDRACVDVVLRREDGTPVTRTVRGKEVNVYVEVIDTPKSGKRVVPLTPLAVAVAKRAIAGKSPDDLLFVNSLGARVNKRGYGTSLQDAAARAAIVTHTGQNVNPHSLRDTFATQALLSGASIKAVSKALGHVDAAMTLNRYSGLLPEDTEALRDGLAAAEARHARARKTPKK
jgi:integrase